MYITHNDQGKPDGYLSRDLRPAPLYPGNRILDRGTASAKSLSLGYA